MKKLLVLSAAATVLALSAACDNTASDSSSEPSAASVNGTNTEPTTDAETSAIELSVSEHCVMTTDTAGIVFSVTLPEEMAAECGNIGLYDKNGNKIADLLDDGNDSDLNAGDLIYSTRYLSESEAVLKLTAKGDNFETASVNVSYVEEITEEDFQEMNKYVQELDAATDSLKDNDGKVPYEKANEAYDIVMECAAKLYDEEKIVEYHRNSDNVEMKFAVGVTYIFEINNPLCD